MVMEMEMANRRRLTTAISATSLATLHLIVLRRRTRVIIVISLRTPTTSLVKLLPKLWVRNLSNGSITSSHLGSTFNQSM
jgi:hypothetical protein